MSVLIIFTHCFVDFGADYLALIDNWYTLFQNFGYEFLHGGRHGPPLITRQRVDRDQVELLLAGRFNGDTVGEYLKGFTDLFLDQGGVDVVAFSTELDTEAFGLIRRDGLDFNHPCFI